MRRAAFTLALGTGLLAATLVVAAPAVQRVQDSSGYLIADGLTRVVLNEAADKALPGSTVKLVILPADARDWSATLEGGGVLESVELLGRLRGRPVVRALVSDAGPGAVLAVRHDGDWSAKAAHGRSLDAAIAAEVGLPAAAKAEGHGSYVIITPPAYLEAAEDLALWKTMKGLEVRVATTDETGIVNAEIQDWLREAYAQWPLPPEYVVIVGDVDAVPSWSLSENVTDLPYALMDTDDWLPDLMIGRLPVASLYEAQAVVDKTVAYEKTPWRDDEGWITRQLMVAGNYGSDTPASTVQWCGEQLESLGFESATEVLFPPLFNGVFPITMALEAGVSTVVYRGWAYGTAGWEPPHFTVNDIPNVDNGAMTPVVMSFVCLNGDFAADEPCFGEVFLRQGAPGDPSGAVAFIGNGEHWSHTRYNDAMAISFFERITDAGVTDLGGLMTAGKLRFMEYFPHEMEFAENGEESVEFYFHIYNLLGDPELNFWKSAPVDLDVSHAAVLDADADVLAVTVLDGGGLPLADARAAVSADGVLLGTALSGPDGVAYVHLPAGHDAALLDVVVTRPDAFTHLSNVVVGDENLCLTVTGVTYESVIVDDEALIAVRPTVENCGESGTAAFVLALDVQGYADVVTGELDVPAIAAGDSWTAAGTFCTLRVPADAPDSAEVGLVFTLDSFGGDDLSHHVYEVENAELTLVSALDPAGTPAAGAQSDLTIEIANVGRLTAPGGQATLTSRETGNVTVVSGTAGYAAVAADGAVVLDAPLTIEVPAGLPEGTVLPLRLTFEVDGVTRGVVDFELTAGTVDSGAPVGPDAYGYWALDSADIEYPALKPEYAWTHLDPEFGGEGVEIEFVTDNSFVTVDLPFDFTYYGETYTGPIRLSENGWISFDTSDYLEFYNWPIPNTHGNAALIAAFWDGFDPTLEVPGGVFTRYDSAAGTFTIEWSRMVHYIEDVLDVQTFQLVLFDPAVHPTTTGDGEILVQYRQVLDNDFARQYSTVGLESHDETVGLQLTYAGVHAPGFAPVGPGLAVLFTTETPVFVPYTATLRAAAVGGGVELTWTPDDARPLTAWSITRIDAGGRTLLTPEPLPAGTRRFVDADAGEDARYELTSLHPYGHRAVAARAARVPRWEPLTLQLDAALPNPARGEARLAFALPRQGRASLRIYDVAGRLVRTLIDGEIPAGPGARIWDGRDRSGEPAAAGLYFYRLESAGEIATRKLLLVR